MLNARRRHLCVYWCCWCKRCIYVCIYIGGSSKGGVDDWSYERKFFSSVPGGTDTHRYLTPRYIGSTRRASMGGGVFTPRVTGPASYCSAKLFPRELQELLSNILWRHLALNTLSSVYRNGRDCAELFSRCGNLS